MATVTLDLRNGAGAEAPKKEVGMTKTTSKVQFTAPEEADEDQTEMTSPESPNGKKKAWFFSSKKDDNADKSLGLASSGRMSDTMSFRRTAKRPGGVGKDVDDDEHHKELIKEAEAHLQAKLPGGGVFGLFTTSPAVFGHFGIGIELYFRFTRMMILIMAIMAVHYIPLLVFNLMGDSLRLADMSNVGIIWEFMTKTFLPNLGTIDIIDSGNASISDSNVTTLTMNNSNITVNVESSESLFGMNVTYERNVVLFSKLKIQDVTFIAGLLDAWASLLVLLVAWWFEFHEIPRCVNSHRNEFVTPRIYSIYVDCLPKRIFGGGGHEAYAKRLKQHFELLLEAQVTTKSAHVGMKVVMADENWCRRPPGRKKKRWCNCRLCPLRSDGWDYLGRRIGHITKVSGSNCMVQWHKTPDHDTFNGRCRLSNGEDDGDVLDSHLITKMELAGLEPVASGDKAPEHENAVFAVSMIRDFDGALNQLKAQASAKDRLLEKKIRQGQRKGRSRSFIINEVNQRSQNEADLDFNSDIKLNERDVVGAFVTFTHTQYRDFIHAVYRFTRTPFRQCLAARRLQFSGHSLRVRDAVAPTEVFWNNLDFDDFKRFKRRLIVWFISFVLIGAVILTVAYAKQQSLVADAESSAECGRQGEVTHHFCLCIAAGYVNVMRDEPSGIYELCKEWSEKKLNAGIWSLIASLTVCAVCAVGGGGVGFLASFVKPTSISDHNMQILHMTTIIYVLCLGTVNVFVNANFDNLSIWVIGNGDFKDLTPQWYVTVGTSTVLTVVANTFFPLVSMLLASLYFVYVHLMKNRKRLLIDLLELYTPPVFPFALRHAEQMSNLIVLLIFCGGMPVLAFLCPITFILHYATDKWTFLRASLIPPRYSEKLMISQVQLLQIAIWLHSSWSAWTYSNEETAPSHCILSDEILCTPALTTDSLHIRLRARLFRLSALPSTAISVLILFSLLCRLLFFIVGHNMIVYLEHHIPKCCARFFVGGDFDEFNADSSFTNEITSMRRRGVPTNYDIDKVQGYEFLADKAEDKNAYWRKALGVAEDLESGRKADDKISEAVALRRNGKTVLEEATPLTQTIGSKARLKPLKKSMSNLATVDRAASSERRAAKKHQSSPAGAANEREGLVAPLVTVDAARLSLQAKGKGKGKRVLKKKAKSGNAGEAAASPRMMAKSSSESSRQAIGRAAKRGVAAKYLSDIAGPRPPPDDRPKHVKDFDPFPQPDDLDDHLLALHHDDLGAARQRLGIRRTVQTHEQLIAAAKKKFKMGEKVRAKGKGKGSGVPQWAKLEEESDT